MEEKAAARLKKLVTERKAVLDDIGRRATFLSEAAQANLTARLHELAGWISVKVQEERQPRRREPRN